MKHCLIFPVLLVCLSLSAQTDHSLFTTDTLPVSEAVNHFGEYKAFCDQVKSINKFDHLEGKPTMMRLGEASPGITLVIWEGDAKKFEKPLNEIFAVGDKICVTGQISSFGGSPRLEVGTPRQLHMVK